MRFTAVVSQEGKLFVALAPGLGVASQGKSVEAACVDAEEAIGPPSRGPTRSTS